MANPNVWLELGRQLPMATQQIAALYDQWRTSKKAQQQAQARAQLWQRVQGMMPQTGPGTGVEMVRAPMEPLAQPAGMQITGPETAPAPAAATDPELEQRIAEMNALEAELGIGGPSAGPTGLELTKESALAGEGFTDEQLMSATLQTPDPTQAPATTAAMAEPAMDPVTATPQVTKEQQEGQINDWFNEIMAYTIKTGDTGPLKIGQYLKEEQWKKKEYDQKQMDLERKMMNDQLDYLASIYGKDKQLKLQSQKLRGRLALWRKQGRLADARIQNVDNLLKLGNRRRALARTYRQQADKVDLYTTKTDVAGRKTRVKVPDYDAKVRRIAELNMKAMQEDIAADQLDQAGVGRYNNLFPTTPLELGEGEGGGETLTDIWNK